MLQLEKPAQDQRNEMKANLFSHIQEVESNLTKAIQEKSGFVKELFENYSSSLSEYHQIEDEIPWEMLSSLAYVNSISSTTGNFDKWTCIIYHVHVLLVSAATILFGHLLRNI